MVEMNIGGLREMEDLSRRLKEAGRGDLQRRARREIVAAAQPVQAQLRAAAAGIDVTSSRGGRARPDVSTGLRARLARAVGIRPEERGVRFVVDADKVDPRYGAALSRYSDGEIRRYRRWRHPVFDNSEVWTSQTGSPWFFRTIRANRDKFEDGIRRAMDAVARDITR